MELNRITHPLRLAKGSHQPDSGRGCAMNVISFINGDARVTDFPACSARPLSLLVQTCNDLLAACDGYLSPESSLLALELAWQTVGTADVPDTVAHAWIAELLTSPTWGLVGYAPLTAIKAIVDTAEMHRAAAIGAMPTAAEWATTARAVHATSPTRNSAGLYAIRAAYDSTSAVGCDLLLRVDEVIGHAINAHAIASEGAPVRRIVQVTGCAIRAWRALAGLDDGGDGDPASHGRRVTPALAA